VCYLFIANIHFNLLLYKFNQIKSNQNVAKKYMNIYTQYIFDELDKDNTFAKIILDLNSVQCSNETVRLDIIEKIKKINIAKYYHHSNKIIFFASLIDYKILQKNANWINYEQLPFEHLPIYRRQNDLEEYLNLLFKNKTAMTAIFETQRYNKKLEYWFDEQEKCKSVAKQWEQTNPEFKNFKQHLFHAGNEKQLERFAYIYFRTMFDKKEEDEDEGNDNNDNYLQNNVWKDEPVSFPPQIYKTTFATVRQTMDYMMNKMKKGILVGIQNNQLTVFLPFSKANYQNTFWKELYFNDADKKLLQKIDQLERNRPYSKEQQELLKKLQKKSEDNVYEFLKENKLPNKDIIANRKKWVANDCFFRYEDFEGDQNVLLFYDFLTELCKKRKLEDCIFVLNVRDHPVLDMFLRDSYSSIIDEPLAKKYVHNSYCPIFSVGCEKTKLDLPFITQDDWSQVSQKYYFDNCDNGYVGNLGEEIGNIPWENKLEKAVFRGSATGCATGMDNIRIFATHLSQQYPDLIDAGITAKNRKIKKKLGEPLQVSNFKITEAKKMTLKEKATFKYILNLDGHVSAFRLGHEFSLGSLILLPLSPYYLWFSFALKPFIHYIPVHPKLQDLAMTIQWCKENDDYCKQIAENGREFYNTYLNENGVYDYLQYMISKIAIKSSGLQFKQYADHNIGIVSMFRDNANNPFQRLKQKRYFCYWMDKLMKNAGCKYKIVIVEQNYKDPFNIGKLKNIGYDVLKRTGQTFTNIIFADIDTIPDSVLFDYFFKPMDALCALAVRGTRYTEMNGRDENDIFLGALISATPNAFEQINGFPNNFYGWQGEDENLILRISDTTKKIFIPSRGSVLDLEENANFAKKDNIEKQEELNVNKEKEKQVYEKNFDFMNYPENGLNNLQYKIEYQNKWNNGIHLIVDLLREVAMEKYPHHFQYNDFNRKEDYKKWLKQKKRIVKQIEY